MRGRSSQSLQNHPQHRFCIHQYIIVPKTQYTITHCFEPPCAMGIRCHPFCMLSPVQFHNQASSSTDKIDDIAIDFVLPAEFPSREVPVAQIAPKQVLSVGHVSAQSPRDLHASVSSLRRGSVAFPLLPSGEMKSMRRHSRTISSASSRRLYGEDMTLP